MDTADLPPEPPGPTGPPPQGPPPQGPASPGYGAGPGYGPGPQRNGMDGFFDTIRRMGISREPDRWVGGVASGVATRFGIDPLLVRGILFISAFLSGAGLVLYGLAWALLPERRDGRIHLQQAIRGDFDVAMLGALATFIVGLSWGDGWWSWWDGFGWLNGLFWIAAIVTIAIVVVRLIQRGPRDGRRPVPPQQTPFAGGPWQQHAGPTTQPPTPQQPNAPPAPSATYPAADSRLRVTYPVSGPTDAPTGYPGAPAGQPFSGPPVPQGPSPAELAAARDAERTARRAERDARRAAEQAQHEAQAAERSARRGAGAGSTTVGVVVGGSLLAGAAILLLERLDVIDVPVFRTWVSISVLLLGLGIVIAGLRGRRGGVLTFFAWLVVLICIPFGIWGGNGTPADAAVESSDGTYRATTIDTAEDGFRFSFGDPEVDLTALSTDLATADGPVTVPITLRAGDLNVVVPDDVAVEARVRVLAGRTTWEVDDQNIETNGVNTMETTYTSDEVDTGEEPQLILDIEVGAGDVTIRSADPREEES